MFRRLFFRSADDGVPLVAAVHGVQVRNNFVCVAVAVHLFDVDVGIQGCVVDEVGAGKATECGVPISNAAERGAGAVNILGGTIMELGVRWGVGGL